VAAAKKKAAAPAKAKAPTGARFDEFGPQLAFADRPPAGGVAQVVGVRDPWLGTASANIEPEALARLLRPDTELSQRQGLIKKLAKHPQVFTCMRNLANEVSKLPWECQPFDDEDASATDAEELTDWFNGFPDLKKLVKHLVFGELFILNGAELNYADDYSVDSYTKIDPIRWTTNRETTALRLKTLNNKYVGEDIDRRGFVIHSSSLMPGHWLEQGLWQVIGWLVLFEMSSWEYHMRFAEVFGDPHIYAIYEGAENEKAAFEGVKLLAGRARAAFPKGIEIKIQEAQKYSSANLYGGIRDDARACITKVIQGHVLNTDTESGSGTLAGNHAETVSQANLEGVAEAISETFQRDIVVPWYGWHKGWDVAASKRLAKFILRAAAPVDLSAKATTYVQVNTVLAASGRAIDPSQIEDEFNVKTVEISRAAAPAGENGDQGGDTKEPPKKTKATARRVAAKKPRISSEADLEAAGGTFLEKAVAAFGAQINQIVSSAPTAEEGIAAVFEGYRAMSVLPLASGLRDVTMVREVMSRAEAAE
jgi:phage gp29-like protein